MLGCDSIERVSLRKGKGIGWKTFAPKHTEFQSPRVALAKTVLLAAMMHSVFTVGLPALILRYTGDTPMLAWEIGHFHWLGAAVGGFGIYLYGAASAHLVRNGTSAIPGAEPTVLVTDGWYARIRHPLLLGVVLILLGEAVFFSSLILMGYAATYWTWLTAFVVMREEPDLRQAFGAQFDAYCRAVPRWIPRLAGGRGNRRGSL